MRLTGVALALALAVAVAVTTIAPGCNQDPPSPSSQPEDPQHPAPTPIAMRAELKVAQLAGESHEPVVANQKLIMPDDARLDTLLVPDQSRNCMDRGDGVWSGHPGC